MLHATRQALLNMTRHWMEYAMRACIPHHQQNTEPKSFALSVVKRLGPNMQSTNSEASASAIILALADGDFLVIGTDVTAEASRLLPLTVGRRPRERIIRIPRSTLVLAKPDIPEEV